jgi:hypothetical protein
LHSNAGVLFGRGNVHTSFERLCKRLGGGACFFKMRVEELFQQNFFKKAQRTRILRLSQPEHCLLAHFRVAVIFRDLN